MLILKNVVYKSIIGLLIVVLICTLCPLLQVNGATVYAASKTYTVTSKMKPCYKKWRRYKTYTKYTRTYYMLRSYIKRLSKKGGGTLILKKGTYYITNSLCVPSNITFVFKDGVVIKKRKKTGSRYIKASDSLFCLVPQSKVHKKSVIGSYNGSKNITFKGEGNVRIDMRYYKGNTIQAAHNQNLNISNISFCNVRSGHFVELDANKNTVISNCRFTNIVGDNIREAINLDTPDKKTGGFNSKWSKFDKTPDCNVTITGCTFSNMGRSVGTHNYSGGKYHSNVRIINNTMRKMRSYGIGMMNWSDPVINGNYISGPGSNTGKFCAILGYGTGNPVIYDNTFANYSLAMLFKPYKEVYAATYNKISEENKVVFMRNSLKSINDKRVLIQQTFHGIYQSLYYQ